MRRVFANHQEVCHKWASQSQESGEAGNITFGGRVISSYRHWPMASFDADDPNVVLYRDKMYSSSTGKHQGIVRRVVSHCKVFTVVSGYDGSRIDHALNIVHYRYRMRQAADEFWNARGHIGQWAAEKYNELKKEAQDYAKHYGVELPVLFGYELSGELAKKKRTVQQTYIDTKDEQDRLYRERREAAKTKVQPEVERLCADYEQAWIIHDTEGRYGLQPARLIKVDGFTFTACRFSQIRLRLTKDESQVETSSGARVSVKAAKLLYRMIVAGKAVHGHEIDGYPVIGYNGCLKVGCHEIKRNEIDRFAKVMNWD